MTLKLRFLSYLCQELFVILAEKHGKLIQVHSQTTLYWTKIVRGNVRGVVVKPIAKVKKCTRLLVRWRVMRWRNASQLSERQKVNILPRSNCNRIINFARVLRAFSRKSWNNKFYKEKMSNSKIPRLASIWLFQLTQKWNNLDLSFSINIELLVRCLFECGVYIKVRCFSQ